MTAAHYKGGHPPGNDLGLHYTALPPIVASCPYSAQLLVTRKFWSPGANRPSQVKGDLAIRPIFHQDQARIEAHIFIAFLAYCLHATLARRLHALAPGLSPRSVIEKFAAMQMIDVHVPTTDGRELLLTRYTEPDAELRLLL